MKTKEEIIQALNSIRKMVDLDVSDCDIVDVDKKLKHLTQLTGLSAEANASSKKILHKKELEVLRELTQLGLSPSILNGMLKAECFEEIALLEYADRLNSAIVHSIDGLRSSISLYKTEIQNGLVTGQSNL
jgi:hypothetical protein